MKPAIVSFANERGNYITSLKRLEDSLQGNFDGDFFGFIGEDSVGAPPHVENPYSFKIYAIDRVKRMGYKNILWLDSSVVVRKPLQPVFDMIAHKGYLMQEAGAYVGAWTNDEALKAFGITREEANAMPMYGNAGLLGLNFWSRQAIDFFSRWKWAMEKGLFIGSWDNHRHDMSCGSIIANQMGLTYAKGDEILQYSAPDAPLINETIYFSAQGM